MNLRFSVSLDSSSFSSNVHYICNYLNTQNLLWKEAVCKQCIGQALRQNIVAKANLLNPLGINGTDNDDGDESNIRSAPPPSFDGNIIYSQYLYSTGLVSASTICVVGLIPMTSVIAILLMNPSTAVVYVSNNGLAENPFYNELLQLQSMFTNFHISHTGDCRILHILGMIDKLDDIRVVLKSIHGVRHIVWEKFYTPFANNLDVPVTFYSTGQESVYEFDSVGHWYGGRSYYSKGNHYNDKDQEYEYQVECFVAPEYSLVMSQTMQVFMGTLVKAADYRASCHAAVMEDKVYFITYEQHTFIETAEAIAGVLHRAGFSNVLVMESFNRTAYLQLRQEHCRSNLVQIVIGGHDPHVITGRYILLHTENIYNMYIQMSHYRHILQHAAAVLVYSKAHLEDSKIFFNFHSSSDESVLETHRMNNLLSLGVCIISEYSQIDPDLDAEYEDTIYFYSTFEEMYSMVKKLLADDAMLRECYKKSLDKFSKLMTDTDGLVAAITFADNN
eukprot:gene24899-33390_t